MPIEVSEVKTRSGHLICRAHFAGDITVPEARAYHEQLVPGARYGACGHMAVGNVAGVSPEVRKVLSSQRPDPLNPPPVAVVLTSAIARMAASLAMRMSDNANTEAFKSEADALAWLDGRMAEYEARKVGR